MSQHIQVSLICKRLGPYLQKKNTRMKKTISIESRIAMSLQRLGIGNTLCTIGEAYGVAENTISEIVRIFCKLIRVHLQGTFV